MDKVEIGEMVRYHPIIGGEHDGNEYKVTAIGELSGRRVAWLEGKRGCVALKALSSLYAGFNVCENCNAPIPATADFCIACEAGIDA